MAIDSLLDKAVKRLSIAEPGWKAATTPPAKGAKPGSISTGRPASGKAGGGTSLDESDYTLREHWPSVDITSTDGFFVIQVEPIKSIALEGGGAFTFKQPTT